MIVGLALALALVAPLDAMRLIRPGIRSPALQMCASEVAEVGVEVGVEAAARDVRNLLRLELVRSFVAATERGDAATLMQLCTDDFLYKTHRATTSSLLAAKDRFATRLPAPSKARKKMLGPALAYWHLSVVLVVLGYERAPRREPRPPRAQHHRQASAIRDGFHPARV